MYYICLYCFKVGSDYTPFDDLRLTFTSGVSILCEPFLVRSDMTVEEVESVDILLSSTDIAVIGINRVIITILDDDREFLNILY